jgi:hypothetical protein
MSVDVRLPSGLVFRDAPRMLTAKFGEWPWDKYDGVPVSDRNRIGKADIDRVYQLGARTPRSAYEGFLKEHGVAVSEHLSAIPQAALEDDDLCLADLRKPVVSLFDLLMSVKSIKLAGATKLLAPFRPALLPVIDSVVENYYWYATSITDENSFRNLERTHKAGTSGEYVFGLLELIREDVRGACAQIDKVRHACGDALYAKASRVRVVESLIWFYYARGG